MTEGRDPLLQEREKTHGDFRKTARIAIELKHIFRREQEYDSKSSVVLEDKDYRHGEALDLIATKIARLLAGDKNHKDTWLDIAGYAKLGAEACD